VTPVAKSALTLGGAGVLGVMIVLVSVRLVERQQTSEEINRLREELYQARITSDRCRGTLLTSESSLLVLGMAIDSMKSRVDSFEALDRRGVPTGRYEEYLQLFDAYNDSVEVWDVRKRRLRTSETSCRETITEHNTLSDSLQAVLSVAGIEAD
jgi:hypothetical protein